MKLSPLHPYRRIFTLAFVLLCFAADSPAPAQQKFPDWMDEVETRPANKQTFNEPDLPIDPATGQPAAERARRKGFKPELPDFKKMREKAIKAEMEKKSNDANSLEKSYSMSVNNLEQLNKNKTELEQLLAANPGDNARLQLLDGLKDIENKIKLSLELLALIDGNNASGSPKQTIASLTANQFDRALALQKQLFSNKPMTAGAITGPTPPADPSGYASTPDSIEDDTELEARAAKNRLRPYRPGRIKSFYLESKEAQKKAAEEADKE